jgi:hypothetical protein
MTMKVPTILMFAMVLATPCRADRTVMTATWFADHPDERSKVNALCKDNPGEAKHNANCENAFQGDVIAETRAAQAKTGMRVGVSPSDPAYWRDPANAEDFRFWSRQCAIAAQRHAPPHVMVSMWCPAIRAAGG